MNVPNVNNNGISAGRPVNQPGDTGAAETTRRASDTTASDKTAQTRDTYQNTRDREIGEIAAQVGRIPDEPRDSVMMQARERVSQGYYNQPNVVQNIATQLINTGR